MSDDIPAAKRRGRPRKNPSSLLTEQATIQFSQVDFRNLCRMAQVKREEKLGAMLRAWVLERLAIEARRESAFIQVKNTEPERIM